MPSFRSAIVFLMCACALVALNSFRMEFHPEISQTPPLRDFHAMARTKQQQQQQQQQDSEVSAPVRTSDDTEATSITAAGSPSPRCAINLYGLPRAFQSLVLPSLKMNVIPINPSCDYFVHYYNKTHEEAGRSGAGGVIHPDEIRLLTDAVHEINPQAIVQYGVQDELDFTTRRAKELAKLKQKNYQPKEFDMRTTQNIIKMWNSIQAAWDLMQEYSQSQGFEYSRVAMLRADVLFATPLDIWEIQSNAPDVKNQVAVIPAFASWPVNDRMVYGPNPAVREWAARRFEYMDDHVQWTTRHKRGFGIHSEVFVAHRVIPNIKKMGYQVWEHDTLCFMRARPDQTIWLNDCDAGNDPNVAIKAFGGQDCTKAVEKAINRTCVPGTKAWIETTKTVTLLCRES